MVMPTFLEFVFPFGQQNTARDFHLMGFRSASRYTTIPRGLPIADLDRSGRYLELCYSLKSVEGGFSESPDQAHHWFIRQCSMYHYFDLKTQQAVWIVVKGNKLVADALQHNSRSFRQASQNCDTQPTQPFQETLAHHSVVASWAGENWQWYIGDLEAYLQKRTQSALTASWDLPPEMELPQMPLMSEPKPLNEKQRASSWRSIQKPIRRLTKSTFSSDFWLGPTPTSTITSEAAVFTSHNSGFDSFSFRDLQHVHWVEERANEARLVLRGNVRVLSDLNNEYVQLTTSSTAMCDVEGDWQSATGDFSRQLANILQDMSMQCSRVESLLRLVDNRKALVRHLHNRNQMRR